MKNLLRARAPRRISHTRGASLVFAAACIATLGCAHLQPAPVRPATVVKAPFSKTWDAVIDEFGDHNTPIDNMERASGFISTRIMSVQSAEGAEWARCVTILGTPGHAQFGAFNVIVRQGSDSTATVHATTNWTGANVNCVTTGVWEADFENIVKARAEGRPYVADSATAMTTRAKGVVGEGTRMYESADSKSKTVHQFTGIDDVIVLQVGSVWSRVRFGSLEGWVPSSRLRIKK